MSKEIGKFEAARRVSGLTAEKVCSTCEFTRPTLAEREQNPDSWRLGELRNLNSSLTEDGTRILQEAIISHIFLP